LREEAKESKQQVRRQRTVCQRTEGDVMNQTDQIDQECLSLFSRIPPFSRLLIDQIDK